MARRYQRCAFCCPQFAVDDLFDVGGTIARRHGVSMVSSHPPIAIAEWTGYCYAHSLPSGLAHPQQATAMREGSPKDAHQTAPSPRGSSRGQWSRPIQVPIGDESLRHELPWMRFNVLPHILTTIVSRPRHAAVRWTSRCRSGGAVRRLDKYYCAALVDDVAMATHGRCRRWQPSWSHVLLVS